MPPGLNTRCTRIFPRPVTVTLTAVGIPSASVPDIGETTTFPPRPGGSETDQLTVPPEVGYDDAQDVMDLAAGLTETLVGFLRDAVPAS